MPSDPYGTCRCGYVAADWESARVHIRDEHNSLGTPGGSPSEMFNRDDVNRGDGPQTDGGTETTTYVPQTKKCDHHPSIGSTASVQLPDSAVGVTIDYESGTLGGGEYIIRYLVPESEFDGGDGDGGE